MDTLKCHFDSKCRDYRRKNAENNESYDLFSLAFNFRHCDPFCNGNILGILDSSFKFFLLLLLRHLGSILI